MKVVNSLVKSPQIKNVLKKAALPVAAGLMLTASALTASATNKKIDKDTFEKANTEQIVEEKQETSEKNYGSSILAWSALFASSYIAYSIAKDDEPDV